jgi:hypothetical protein
VEGLGKEEVARIMYTHVSTCKNDKINLKKEKNWIFTLVITYLILLQSQCSFNSSQNKSQEP